MEMVEQAKIRVRRPFAPMLEARNGSDLEFAKNWKRFKVAKRALADVIEALSGDQDREVRIAVAKEDGNLVVMFDRRGESRASADAVCPPSEAL